MKRDRAKGPHPRRVLANALIRAVGKWKTARGRKTKSGKGHVEKTRKGGSIRIPGVQKVMLITWGRRGGGPSG